MGSQGILVRGTDVELPFKRSRSGWWLLGVLGCVCACVVLGWTVRQHRIDSQVPTHTYELQAAHMGDWTPIGGSWQTENGVLYNVSAARGAKLLTGSTAWRNYTVTADVRFGGTNADMGVIVRTNDEKEGTDTYSGYYIGVRTLDETFVIGRSDFAWREAHPVHMPGGVSPNVWYRLRTTAYQCDIGSSLENLESHQMAWLAVEDPSCLAAGRIGMRSLNSGGLWRNISVTSATLDDYLAIRRHAASVEQPEVLPGPAWWTPWHAGALFGGTLLLALSAQLTYFRVRQWKVSTITRERERLAHDIHDTMAQGFAGIGYQIQGIRHNLLRSERVDSHEISTQLSVAYQLVRRCHKEASRTIAMLGSSAPPSQKNLLETLEETAYKLASGRIRTVMELRGDPIPLNLRLVDALLHIGGEAIVNAVDHSELTILKITLAYVGNNVELLVEDDGSGFDYGPLAAGYGILGMQKRTRDIGGIFEIQSTRGSGTRVRVTAKVQQETLLPRLAATFQDWFGRRSARMPPP